MKDPSPKERTKTYRFKTKEEEYTHISTNAKALGLSINDYIRLICFNTTLEFVVDLPPVIKDKEENSLISINLTPLEHEYLTQKSLVCNIPLGEYLRLISATTRISFKIDETTLNTYSDSKWDNFKHIRREANKKRRV